MSSVTSASSQSQSEQVRVALAFLDGYTKWSLEALTKYMAEDFEEHTLPPSLGLPVQDKAAWIKSWHDIYPLFRGLTYEILEIIEAPGRVVIHATSTGESTTEVQYDQTYMYIFQFTAENGETKIKLLKQYLDSLYTKEFFTEEMYRQMAKRQKLEEEEE